jgi:uncharacterized membrane protein YtjA (UPF0391 family)
MTLLRWALAFLVISLIAALFGFTPLAVGAQDIARILFVLFLGVVVLLVILGVFAFRSVP